MPNIKEPPGLSRTDWKRRRWTYVDPVGRGSQPSSLNKRKLMIEIDEVMRRYHNICIFANKTILIDNRHCRSIIPTCDEGGGRSSGGIGGNEKDHQIRPPFGQPPICSRCFRDPGPINNSGIDFIKDLGKTSHSKHWRY